MVVVTGQDREGKDFRIKARDWLARVFQHEIDHLDGRLFIDLTDKVWRADEAPPEGIESIEVSDVENVEQSLSVSESTGEDS
jgi:peptide deformylase